jgi:protein SCO1/2
MSLRPPALIGALLAAAAALFIAGAAVWAVNTAGPRQATTPSSIGGPFRLVNQDGRTVTDADFKGRPFIVFFGYTHCPDICPTTLYELGQVLARLGSDADRIAVLFVTVDPERDTPAVLKRYLASFGGRIEGLGGDPADVARMVREYRAYARKVPAADGSGNYTMDHTAVVYLMDAHGRFVEPLNLQRPDREVAAELRGWL